MSPGNEVLDAYRRERIFKRWAWAALWLTVGAVGALGALLLNGCATGSTALRPGQEQAAWIVWVQVYGRNDAPPLIRWVTDLPCTDQSSQRPGFYVVPSAEDLTDADEQDHGTCREGFTWRWDEISVAYHQGDNYSDTAMAHELLHAALLRYGIFPLPGRGHHQRPDFFPLVDLANHALRAAGR